MRFRLRALLIHLLGSALILSILLGCLYFGWYRWPGWRLADAAGVVMVMIGVDLVLGPLLTLVIANQKKPRRELVRDWSVIVAIQLCALVYGSLSLWNGRPLYYAFSESVLQLVQAYDIDAGQAKLGQDTNPALAPHWNSLPRWIWAPLPADPDSRQAIVTAAISGGDDVISMPKYYKPWSEGLASLRSNLKKVDDVTYFTAKEKKALKQRMLDKGLAPEQLNVMPLTGRGLPMLAVFDLTNLKITTIITPR